MMSADKVSRNESARFESTPPTGVAPACPRRRSPGLCLDRRFDRRCGPPSRRRASGDDGGCLCSRRGHPVPIRGTVEASRDRCAGNRADLHCRRLARTLWPPRPGRAGRSREDWRELPLALEGCLWPRPRDVSDDGRRRLRAHGRARSRSRGRLLPSAGGRGASRKAGAMGRQLRSPGGLAPRSPPQGSR
jgi:hypothetical protein